MASAKKYIRERRSVRLEGLHAYVQALSACLDGDVNASSDRMQAGKRWLRDTLERLERDAAEAAKLAPPMRASLLAAAVKLQNELSTPRPDSAADLASQRQVILAAIAAAEQQLDAIAVDIWHETDVRLNDLIERAVLAMLRLEAELYASESLIDSPFTPVKGAPSPQALELDRKLRSIGAALDLARRLADHEARIIEAQIATAIQDVRELFAPRQQ